MLHTVGEVSGSFANRCWEVSIIAQNKLYQIIFHRNVHFDFIMIRAKYYEMWLWNVSEQVAKYVCKIADILCYLEVRRNYLSHAIGTHRWAGFIDERAQAPAAREKLDVEKNMWKRTSPKSRNQLFAFRMPFAIWQLGFAFGKAQYLVFPARHCELTTCNAYKRKR